MIVDGTTYHDETPEAVVNILETCRTARLNGRGYRLRFHWGDIETGRDWGDTYHVEGYVGRSTGTSKIPLLIWNSRSKGGPAISDHRIVKVVVARGRRVLYQHPTYHEDTMQRVAPGPASCNAARADEIERQLHRILEVES